MAAEPVHIHTTFKLRRGTSSLWASKNPILQDGEPGKETDTGKLKLGDGVSRWLDLEYFLPESGVQSLIDAAISELPGGGDGDLALIEHINSPTPHPAYDEGADWDLLYRNATV